MEELQQDGHDDTQVWAIFGDLMAGLVGVFVLILVWVLGYQLELTQDLQGEVSKREAEQERRVALESERERALADPLASGRVTLRDGRIGISGSVLFALNSDQLQAEGRILLGTLVEPLKDYLNERDELLMISGFTDDLAIQKGNRRFLDNWELSAQRALTVTRALIDAGMPAERVFAAAFGSQQPVAPNRDDTGRSLNRRVEMAPVPRASRSDTLARRAP